MNKIVKKVAAITIKSHQNVNEFLAELCGWLLIVMAALLIMDLFFRSIQKPIQGLAVLSVFTMMIVIYLGLAHCEELDEHIKVSAFTHELPLKYQHIISIFNYILQGLIFGIALYSFGKNAVYSYLKDEAVSGTVPFLLWPVKFVIVIGLLFYWIQILINLIKKYQDLRS